MKKILVILTGGTIGSKSEMGTVDVSSAAAFSIIRLYCERYGSDTEFEVVQPLNILSENMTADIWLKLIGYIDSVKYSNYSGIIICHGSDTLSYTSNILGMLYARLEIPMVLVAANYELDNEKSNGLINFRNAVTLIKSVRRGVFVSYSNDGIKNDIYIATEIVESDPYNDLFRSFIGSPWGEIVNESLVVKGNISLAEIEEFKPVLCSSPKSLDKRVMLIRPYPGMRYDNISLEGIRAVVHYMYHSATACTEGINTSVIKFAQICRKKGVKLYIASFKDRDIRRAYKSSRDILEAGAEPMFNISPEAAYIKVLLSENMNIAPEKNFYFECNDK